MIEFFDISKENTEMHNPNWSQIPNHLYNKTNYRGLESAKTNTLYKFEN